MKRLAILVPVILLLAAALLAGGCNLQGKGVDIDIPDVSVPGIPGIPGVDIPDIPGVDIPDIPGVDIPDVDLPDIDIPDIPGIDLSDMDYIDKYIDPYETVPYPGFEYDWEDMAYEMELLQQMLDDMDMTLEDVVREAEDMGVDLTEGMPSPEEIEEGLEAARRAGVDISLIEELLELVNR